jgi:HK97 family phage portal protein
MGVRQLASRTLRAITRAVEGQPRPGPYLLPVSGGWLPDGADLNWWQEGYYAQPVGSRQAIVEACVSAYAQTISMCPPGHWRTHANGGRTRVTNSALSRVMKRPNLYQSISDFMLNAVRQLYLDGNAYALAIRNDRFEITDLHLMDSRISFPQLAPGGDIFYHLGGNTVVAQELGILAAVPQRDVLHIRLHADRNRRYPYPLRGQTPLIAAATEMGLSETILEQQTSFYGNQARPSAVLQTDERYDKDKAQALRDRWEELTTGRNQGRTPILTDGLKLQPWGAPAKDAQIADLLKLAETHIALAFRVPLQVLGIGGHPFASTEAMMQFWIATGLGFALNHIEEAFGLLFNLGGQPDDYLEFDTKALLRSAMKDRIDALVSGVQGGIFSPNEARKEESLPSVKAGDEPRLQAQVVPLSAALSPPSAPSAPSAPAAPVTGADDSEKSAPKPPPQAGDPKKEMRAVLAAAARARARFN